MPKFYDKVDVLKKPGWLKIRLHRTPEYAEVQQIVDKHALHTICSSGMCPNKAECWSRRTAHWAQPVRAIRTQNPGAVIELLIPDLDAQPAPLDVVVASKPDIIGHNIETVERLTPVVRSKAKYRTSLETLRYLSAQGVATKSGLMVGLGESDDEVLQTLHDLRDAGVGIVTLGQYLRPTLEHYPVAAYITPEKFEWYRLKALEMGFSYCASAPLVRSSYMAEEALKSVKSL